MAEVVSFIVKVTRYSEMRENEKGGYDNEKYINANDAGMFGFRKTTFYNKINPFLPKVHNWSECFKYRFMCPGTLYLAELQIMEIL